MNRTGPSPELLQSAFNRFEQAALTLEQKQESLQKKVTELEREEEEARRRRLEALGRMAAELAHEVRNPLGSIRLFAEMLLEDLEDRPEPRQMVRQILDAAAGLGSTVNNLLSFASPSTCAMRLFDLAAVIRDGCALLAPSCRLRGIRLTGPAEGKTVRLHADPEGFRQITLNLLGNAVTATGEGGRVGMDSWNEDGLTVLEINDNGKGIDPEDRDRVFDPFFSKTEGGTGLGLSIVHGIVERHGGTIHLDSKPGAGTCVRIQVPNRAARHGGAGPRDTRTGDRNG